MTDTIPIGLSRFIKPIISCTPFNPPYWLNNIGNKLIRNAIDREATSDEESVMDLEQQALVDLNYSQ